MTFDHMADIPDGSVDLVMTSPPFDLARQRIGMWPQEDRWS